MFSRARNLFFVLPLTTIPAQAIADDANGNFAVRGVGTAQCGQYTTTYQQGDVQALQRVINWMQGYVSARNKVSEGHFDLLPIYRAEDLVALLNAVCTQNPDIRLEAATHSLIQLFEPSWVTSSSELSVLEQGDLRVPIRNAVLAQVQQALANEGFYEGVVDGVYGARSANALRSYQSEENLEQTGLPDLQTLLRLLVAQG